MALAVDPAFFGEDRRERLERLVDTYEAVATSGRSRLVVLSAPTGWGKTRSHPQRPLPRPRRRVPRLRRLLCEALVERTNLLGGLIAQPLRDIAGERAVPG